MNVPEGICLLYSGWKHLSCCHVKAIIISAATNILAQIFWWIFEHVSVEYVLVVEWNRWGSSGRQVGRGVWTVDGEK